MYSLLNIFQKLKEKIGLVDNLYLVDKTRCGTGLTVLTEPLSRKITLSSKFKTTVCVAEDASLCSISGIAYGDNYILDKNPFSYHIPDAKKIKKPTYKLDTEAISFVGPFMDNYCHLILYILINAPLINERFKNHTLLLPNCLEAIPSMSEAIKICFPFNNVIYLKEPAFVKRLYKIDVVIDENSITSLRELISQNISNRSNYPLLTDIFVMRNGANRRICINQNELLEQLPKNYSLVDCSNMSFLEQFKVFYNAENIVGIHGAALTNIIFCKKLKMFYEFKDPRNDDLIFKSISEDLFKADYQVSYGVPVSSRDFRVKQHDIDNMRNFL